MSKNTHWSCKNKAPKGIRKKSFGHRSLRREGRLFWQSFAIGDTAHWNEMFCSDVWFTLTTELLDRVLHDAQPVQPRGLAQSIMIHLTGSTSLHRIWIWRVLKGPGERTEKMQSYLASTRGHLQMLYSQSGWSTGAHVHAQTIRTFDSRYEMM